MRNKVNHGQRPCSGKPQPNAPECLNGHQIRSEARVVVSSQGSRQCPSKLNFLEPFVEIPRVDWRKPTQGIKPRNAEERTLRQNPTKKSSGRNREILSQHRYPIPKPGNYGLGPASGDGQRITACHKVKSTWNIEGGFFFCSIACTGTV